MQLWRYKFWIILGVSLFCLALVFMVGLRFATRRFLFRLGAYPLPRNPEYLSLFQSLDRLSRRAQLPSPELFLLKDYSPNAFALRRGNRCSIVVTEGLLQVLTQEELEAVLSLCLAQLRLKDFRTSPLATALALPFTTMAKRLPIGFAILLRSFASVVVRFFVNPERMYQADHYAAQVLQNPDLIAMALRKMTSLGRRVPFHKQDIAFDHLFVVSAIHDDLVAATCATHPEPELRIRRLLAESLA